MEPQIQTQTPAGTPAGGQPNSQSPQSTSLDPQVIKLADSIAQTESGGNSKAKGKSGEYGAYQWTAPTWQTQSQAAGVNVPLDQSTPEQQNQVAYNQLATWKKEGYTPAQEASMWNAGTGEPDAYLGDFSNGQTAQGVNGEGVNYDVPQYVSKVMNLFDGGTPTANAASSDTGNTESSSQPDTLSALEGLGIGGLAWLAGKAVDPLKDAATDAATGAVAGSILPGEGTAAGATAGGLAGLVQGVIQDITGDGSTTPSSSDAGTADTSSSSPTPDITQEGNQVEPDKISQNQNTQNPEIDATIQASQVAKDAISQTLQGTQSGRVFSNTPQGQDAINTAAQHGLIEPDEEGNLSFNSQKLQQLESAIEKGKDGIIESQGTTASPVTVANYAGNFIGSDKINTAADRQKAAEIVQKEISADSGGIPMNGQMSLADMRAAQKTHYQAAKASYTNPKPNAEMLAHKALGQAYGKAIRDKIKAEDQPLYDKLTKASRDLTNVKQLKKKIEGKKAPRQNKLWQSFLRSGARYAEIYIGDKLGGPIGAILGSLVGEHLNRAIDKKFGKNIFETKGMRSAMEILHKENPKTYTNLIDELKKHGINPKEDEKETSKGGLIKDINVLKKDDSKLKKQKGLVDLPKKGGAKKGEREIKEGELLKNGGRIRVDMSTGKKYVSY